MKFQAMMMYTAVLLVITFLFVSQATNLKGGVPPGFVMPGDAEPLSDALQRTQEELEQQGW